MICTKRSLTLQNSRPPKDRSTVIFKHKNDMENRYG